MMIAHLPAGYLLTRALAGVTLPGCPAGARSPWFMRAGLLASIFPDLDIVYHYTIDHGRHLHHSYWTHMPFFWLCLFIIWGVIAFRLKGKGPFLIWAVFAANVFLHLLLDTVSGGVCWLWPFSSRSFFLVHVPAIYNWWVWNYLLHRIFLFEAGIVAGALFLYFRHDG